MYSLVYPSVYIKRARKFLKKHPDLEFQYMKTLDLLVENPRHPSLRLHKLAGSLEGLHSVSINLSYRLTLEMLIQDNKIILVDIGSHDEVY